MVFAVVVVVLNCCIGSLVLSLNTTHTLEPADVHDQTQYHCLILLILIAFYFELICLIHEIHVMFALLAVVVGRNTTFLLLLCAC